MSNLDDENLDIPDDDKEEFGEFGEEEDLLGDLDAEAGEEELVDEDAGGEEEADDEEYEEEAYEEEEFVEQEDEEEVAAEAEGEEEYEEEEEGEYEDEEYEEGEEGDVAAEGEEEEEGEYEDEEYEEEEEEEEEAYAEEDLEALMLKRRKTALILELGAIFLFCGGIIGATYFGIAESKIDMFFWAMLNVYILSLCFIGYTLFKARETGTPFRVMLAFGLAGILSAVFSLLMELKRYDYDINAEGAKQSAQVRPVTDYEHSHHRIV